MKNLGLARRRVIWLAAQALAYTCVLCPAAGAQTASDPAFNTMKQVYDAGDYHVASKLAAEIVQSQPQNALAHYYLANALAKLGNTTEARAEYSKCVTLGRGTAIATNAAAALNATSPNAAPSAGNADTVKQRKQLLDQENAAKQSARRRFDSKVLQIQRQCTLPDGTHNDAELKARSKAAFEELSREEATITANFQKRADALFSATKGNSSGTHVVQSGSNMYVQNFENLGDESQAVSIPTENPLEAKALRLGETPVSKGAKVRSKRKGNK